jgi:hypothetical protein
MCQGASKGHPIVSSVLCSVLLWHSYISKIDLAELTGSEKKVLFMNAYNMLTIHGNIVNGHPTSSLQRKNFFSGSLSALFRGVRLADA